MTNLTMFPVVVATTPFVSSFASAFRMSIPNVATLVRGQSITYQWGVLENAKLVIFTGGADINPAIYGQANKHSHFYPERDTAEIEVLKRSLSMGKKILGVCRGHQLINAYLGGILVQDITTCLNTEHASGHILEVVDSRGVIPKLFQYGVNSIHHQGVVKTGEGLIPTTYWRGVYESTEGDGILTTQFHPEWLSGLNNKMGLSLWDYLNSWAHIATGESANA